jgi:hypothetical protein
MYGLNDQIQYDRERIEKMEKAIKLVLALDGQPEVNRGYWKGTRLATWVVRLDPKAREQLENALKS